MTAILLTIASFALVTLTAAPCIIAWEDAGMPTLEEL